MAALMPSLGYQSQFILKGGLFLHIPSERIYNSMRSEVASLWYVPANDGEETAFIIKAPTPTIKALIMGCPFQLFFGKKDPYLCIGVRIEDMPDTPVFISKVQIVSEEHKALMQSIKQRSFPIFLFNEMDICLASSSLEIAQNDTAALCEFIGNESELYVGKFDEKSSHILDCFDFSTNKEQKHPDAYEIPIMSITPKAYEWKTVDLFLYGSQSFEKINISDKIEGKNFENIICGSLDPVFPTTLYKNPKVKKGNNIREFTDVFAYYEYGSFLIEAKDLSVIQAGYNKDESKRLSGIQKQAEKAIKQLIGAAKAFKCGDSLFDDKGNEIIVDRSHPPHCIILITELMFSGNWDHIINNMIEAMEETGAFFHLLDLREFTILLKKTSGKPEVIDYNLMQRCKLFTDKKSVFIRAR